MPILISGESSIHFEEYGSGYPVLLFAPGGMRSRIDAWRRNPANPDQVPPWMDPTVVLADRFRVIAMDQRNAGSSTAPVRSNDGWRSYAGDHIALLDHLGLESCHVMGGCIGSSYALALAEAAPGRVTAAILQNPIGLAGDNRQAFYDMFASWARDLGETTEVQSEALARFCRNMFSGDFVFAVTRDFVRSCAIPMLVLPGNDTFHPTAVADEIVALAPRAEKLADWKGPAFLDRTIARVRAFLDAHRPEGLKSIH